MYNKTLFLRIWVTMVGLLGLPVALVTGGFNYKFLLFIIVCFFLSWPVFLIIHLSGSSMVNILYGLGKPASKREQLQGDYQKAKCLFADSQFNVADEVINGVLEKYADYGDALLLKAQILQRSGGLIEAKEVIYYLLRNCKNDPVNCRWARSILAEIDEALNTYDLEEKQPSSAM